ncbi:BspA family leucine-rich repeat surface protein [Salegentibacter sediminis]|uniref:BspA family leucine-rich repeat surface protein n=1 Tax=Salegentibacter sediminis TaxID=1930251 RepID=UPI0018E3D419|nr:BspA family leucine-rich repeat surface protein [Salegentibacter sediminis]
MLFIFLSFISGTAMAQTPADENFESYPDDGAAVQVGANGRTVGDLIFFSDNISKETAIGTDISIGWTFFPTGDRYFSYIYPEAETTEIGFKSASGDSFKLVSLAISNSDGLNGSRTENYIVRGFDENGVEVASDNLNLATSDGSGSINYNRIESVPTLQDGILTFNSDWENVQRVTFTGTDLNVGITHGPSLSFDNFDFEPAVTSTFTPYVTTWKTDNPGTSSSTSITIPTNGTGYNYDVDWNNDGIYEDIGVTGDITHDYGTAGTYTVAIRGDFPRIYFANGGDKDKIISVDQWGDIVWNSMARAFQGCSNVQFIAVDIPNLANVTDMSYMFYQATSFNGDISTWDVSSVTNMHSMFLEAKAFNQNIGNWNVSNVKNMGYMFRGASSFNQNIGSWNVGNVTDMQEMFLFASAFDQNIGNWNVSQVVTMRSMFNRTTFNQNIGNWDVGNVTNMSFMFSNAAFNQDLNTWNVSKVTDMGGMFYGNRAFNGKILNWDVSQTQNMYYMFRSAIAFNQDISNWNVSNVKNMRSMFYSASSFNQNISNWNVGNVTDMQEMFYYARNFNHNIGSWDVSNVSNMRNMFSGASEFDQDLGTWDIGNVTDMSYMFKSIKLSRSNYDNILKGWSTLDAGEVKIPTNVTFDGGNSTYCDGEAAREELTATYNWTITDAGPECPDTEAPVGYAISIDQASIDENNETSISFTFADAEPGTTYNYTFSSDNGGTDVTGSGSIVTATDQITGINISGLEDGTITLSVTLTDASLNEGIAATDSKLKATNQAPVAICKAFTAKLDATGNVSISPEDVNSGSSDDKAGFILSLDEDTFDCSNVGSPVTVTLTITDSEGLSDSCTATVTVQDNVVPVVATQNITVQLDANGEASIVPADINDGSTDNCAIDTYSLDIESFTCADVNSPVTVTLTVKDVNRNSASETATVTVEDNVAPIALAQNITVYLDQNGTTSITPDQIDNGSTDACGIAELSLDITEFSCENVGANEVTLTVTDKNGNLSQATAIVTVEDNIAPIALAQNITVQLDENGVAKISPEEIDNGSSDNCEINEVALLKEGTAFSEVGEGQNLSITLPAGKVVTAVNFASYGTPTGGEGDYALGWCHAANSQQIVESYALGKNSFTIPATNEVFGDPCVGTVKKLFVAVSYSAEANDLEFTCNDLGENMVTLKVTDKSGNSSESTATVTVEDDVLPTAIAQDITIYLDEDGKAVTNAVDVNSNSTDNCFIESLSLSKTQFDCTNVGENTVELTVTDPSGNEAIAEATVTVVDNIVPVVLTQNITVQLDENGEATITPEDIDNGSTDNCEIDSMNLDKDSFDCTDVDTPVTVTLTVTDVNGNKSSETAIVTVEDNLDPVVVSQDITVQLDADGVASIVPSDIDNGSSDNCEIDSMSLDIDSFDCADVDNPVTVTLIVVDVHGNESSETATVNVEDNVVPVAVTQDITVQLDADGVTSILPADIDNGSSDNCEIDTMNLDIDSFSCSDIDNPVTVILTVTDVNGNKSSETAIVTVEDNIAPEAISKNITVQLDENGVATITPEEIDNGSKDACGIADLRLNITEFSCADVGENEVILTVKDENGNTSEATAIVTVEDNVDPVVITQNITVQLDQNGTATITPEEINNGSNDACGIADLSLNITEFNCENVGENEVILTVEDNNGNTSEATAIVTVEDNVDPVVITRNITVQLDQNGTATITPEEINNGSNDACGIADLSLNITEFNCENVGENEVIFTVEDNNGNTSEATAIVTVEDNVDPVVIAQNITVQLDADGTATITPEEINNGSNDACGNADLSLNITEFNCENVGENEVILTVKDENGNTSEATAIVTVEDKVDPVVITRNITVQLDQNGTATITPEEINNGSNDACGIADLRLDITEFSCTDVGENEVILTVEDENGNESSETATVIVVDNLDPIVVTKDITVQLDADGVASILPADIDNGSSDNCDIDTMSLDQDSFACNDVNAPVTVTLTVTDVNGNESSGTAIVTIEDKINPLAQAQNFTVQLDENGVASITSEDIDNGSNDACGIAELSLDITEFSCEDVGENEVTLTVTDNNGNLSQATAIVTVEDNIAPLALAQNISVELDENGRATITPDMIDNGSNDACGIAELRLDITEFSCKDVGRNVVTLTVTDNNGNTSKATAIVTIEDNVAPVTITQNITVQLDENGVASITPEEIDNGSNDACGIAEITLDKTEFSCENLGANEVTLTVADNNGNTSKATAIITVEDNVAPIALAQDITVQLDENGVATITSQDINNGSNDACGIADLSLDVSNFECVNVGENEVILTVTDNNGNTSEAIAIVTVEDNLDPVAIAKDITVQLDENGKATITPEMIDNGSNDSCGIAEMSLDFTEFSCADLGVNPVKLSVTDSNGNVASVMANVTVLNIQPLELMQANLPEITSECAIALSDLEVPKASGLCNTEILASTQASEVIGESMTITWMFEDESGNTLSQTQQITIEDKTAPVPNQDILEDIIVECSVENISAPTATDNCGGQITATTGDPTSYTQQGDYIITWTFTDAAGNSTTQDQFVVVEDITAPVAQASDLNIEIDFNDSITIRPEDIDAGSYDECGEVTLSLDRDYFDEEGTYDVILTVTDPNGNIAQTTATVNVSLKKFQTTNVHVVPTMLEPGEVAKVIVSGGSLIKNIEVLETETGKYKVIRGNDLQQMNLDVAPFKGTLLIRVADDKGKVHLKKIIAL